MEWSKLNNHQLGKYGEYFAKMEFTKYGLDVYTAEVDDKGIDLVVRREVGRYIEVQVKSVRKKNYAFMRKRVFEPRKDFYLALLIFSDEITFALIPSREWKKAARPLFLVDRDYEQGRTAPEYGINLSAQSISVLQTQYSAQKTLKHFTTSSLSVEKPVAHRGGQDI